MYSFFAPGVLNNPRPYLSLGNKVDHPHNHSFSWTMISAEGTAAPSLSVVSDQTSSNESFKWSPEISVDVAALERVIYRVSLVYVADP